MNSLEKIWSWAFGDPNLFTRSPILHDFDSDWFFHNKTSFSLEVKTSSALPPYYSLELDLISSTSHYNLPGSWFTWFAASAERKSIFRVENFMNHEVWGCFPRFSHFLNFFIVLQAFPGQILIPGEISCPGMVSDLRNIKISLKMTILLTTNHHEKKIIIYQACRGLRSQLSQQMNTKLRKSDAEYIYAQLVNLKFKFECTEFKHEAKQHPKFIIFKISSSKRLLNWKLRLAAPCRRITL